MNPTLPTDELRGLHLPLEPGWWPPAPGWWIALVVFLLVLFFAQRQWRRYKRANRWKQVALREYQSIVVMPVSTAVQRAEKIQCCSVLLRRIALALLPRAESAGTTGEAWLQQLDTLGGAQGQAQAFSDGPGRLLLEAPYQAPGGQSGAGATPADIAALLVLLKRMICRHRWRAG